MARIAIVDGIRTPFIKSWTEFAKKDADELGALCVRELVELMNLSFEAVDEVIMGAVSQPAHASNVARVIGLRAGLPKSVPAYTISRNCASGFESITSAYEKIVTGTDAIVIAGGCESMSNIKLYYNDRAQAFFMRLARARTAAEKLKVLAGFRLGHLSPVSGLECGLTDPVCGLSMGQTAEIVAKEVGISRADQDAFALQSHMRALAARDRLREEVMPVMVGRSFEKLIEDDNGPRDGLTLDKLAKLKPVFDRRSGTVTAGNACQITDGACAVAVMEEGRAKSLGYRPLGYIRAYAHVGVDPSRMGLGPAYAIPVALNKADLKLKDIDFIEINEAFAAQVLACVRLLESPKFARDAFGLQSAIGEIDMMRLNVNGGAIALGHPVGVSGARLVLTILKQMKRVGAKFGLASLCVGGGQGGAIILER